MNEEPNRRILLVDDTASIHEDFKKILTAGSSPNSEQLSDAKALFMGEAPAASEAGSEGFEIESAYQGQEAAEMVRKAIDDGNPYAMAFVDIRMPPGWDGIETIENLWKHDPELQVVICTAFSDYSWDQTIGKLGQSDRLLILKKPFDSIEICQMAAALTEKWNTARRERKLVKDLKRAEQEARAYAASLVTVNRALETSKAAADKSSELKTEFLVHLSGEIHQNLDRIMNQAGLLSQVDDNDSDQLELLELVLTASHRLTVSLDQILDITLIESSRLALETANCSPKQLIDQVIEEFSAMAQEQGITLESEISGTIPETIQTDPLRFRQIIGNLVENAIRYTDEGSVRVLVATEQTGDWKRPNLRCDVIDTGTGIASEQHGTLFEPFTKLDSSRPGGTGLGLALSKRLARLLSAEISVESIPGRGSTFTFTIETGNLSGVKMTDC
jgi:two-component system sensor histidine kinase/response regulator